MDFVNDLPHAIDTLEIAIDDCGRAEFLNGRLRITLIRELSNGDETIVRIPAVCLVCSPKVFQSIRAKSPAILEMIDEAENRAQHQPLRVASGLAN